MAGLVVEGGLLLGHLAQLFDKRVFRESEILLKIDRIVEQVKRTL